jgi:tetratricopeptide (TPR) repeat protein
VDDPISTVATVLAVLLALVLLALLLRAWGIRRFRLAVTVQHEAYRRGDYEGQLQAAEALKKSVPPAAHLYFRSAAFFELGRLKEAEDCLTQSCAMEYNSYSMALYKDELGQVLTELGRYEEAITCFAGGIPHWPRRGGCYRGIAAALLRQGGHEAEALRWARLAAALDKIHEATRPGVHDLDSCEARTWNLGQSRAILAWAEAENSGDAEEVEWSLAKAFTLCPETAVPVGAQVRYHAGRAYSALGDAEESASQFERAASLDPHGNYGRLAKAALP